jgi:hypothetical protein
MLGQWQSPPRLEVGWSAGIESQYVFRGKHLADESAQMSLDATYGNLYGALWSNWPLAGGGEDAEIDLIAGYFNEINPLLGIDVGLTGYWYPETTAAAAENWTTELALGADGELPFPTGLTLYPKVYLYYDFDLEDITIEARVGYGRQLPADWTLNLGAYAGYVELGDDAVASSGESSGRYTYGGAVADFVYHISRGLKASLGLRVSGISSADVHNRSDAIELWTGALVSGRF